MCPACRRQAAAHLGARGPGRGRGGASGAAQDHHGLPDAQHAGASRGQLHRGSQTHSTPVCHRGRCTVGGRCSMLWGGASDEEAHSVEWGSHWSPCQGSKARVAKEQAKKRGALGEPPGAPPWLHSHLEWPWAILHRGLPSQKQVCRGLQLMGQGRGGGAIRGPRALLFWTITS